MDVDGEHARPALIRQGRAVTRWAGPGYGDDGGGPGVNSVELYDPVSGSWSAAGDTTTLRQDYTMTPLADGRVLVAGGLDRSTDTPLASAEIFDPDTGTWSPTGTMGNLRAAATRRRC